MQLKKKRLNLIQLLINTNNNIDVNIKIYESFNEPIFGNYADWYREYLSYDKSFISTEKTNHKDIQVNTLSFVRKSLTYVDRNNRDISTGKTALEVAV